MCCMRTIGQYSGRGKSLEAVLMEVLFQRRGRVERRTNQVRHDWLR